MEPTTSSEVLHRPERIFMKGCSPSIPLTTTSTLNSQEYLLESSYHRSGVFPFLKLWGELRNKIYRYAVVAEEPITFRLEYRLLPTQSTPTSFSVSHPRSVSPSHSPHSWTYYLGAFRHSFGRIKIALLCVNRQIHGEAHSILYTKNSAKASIKNGEHFNALPCGGLYSSMLDSPVGPNVTNFNNLTKLNIHLDMGSYIPFKPSGHLRQKMEMLITTALNSPSLRTIEIVLTFSRSERRYLSEMELESEPVESRRLVNEGFVRLSELLHVETFVVVTERDSVRQDMAQLVPSTSKIEFR